MLTDLKGYLVERRAASLSEMALRFSAAPDALRPMLEHWIRKGKVRRTGGAKCGGCASCAAADIEFYEWLEPQPADVVKAPGDRGCCGS
jgi:putative ferrous iron transport protein C